MESINICSYFGEQAMSFNLSGYKNIAIINFHHIGDTVGDFSLFKYCRLQAPQAKITIFLGKENGVLAPYIDCCDEAIVLPVTSKKRRYLQLTKAAFKYRGQFDLVICGLEPRKYIHIFMWLLGARTSIAYIENTWHSKLINQGVVYNEPQQRQWHNALHMLNVVADYRELPQALYPRINLTEEIKHLFLPQIMAKLGEKIVAPRLLVSVTNNRVQSTIDLVTYCDLFAELKKQFDFSVIVSYLPKDKARADELVRILPVAAIALVTPNFSEFLVLLDLIDCCLLGDGGITHLAAALNKPQVVLFGGVSLIEWRPLSSNVRYLYHQEHVKYIDKKTIVLKLEEMLRNK